MEKPKYEEIKALGKKFSLGYMYDIRRHTVIDKSLWDGAELKDDKLSIEDFPFTDFKVSISDNIDDQVSLMDISASLKMSFLAGLIEVSGSAKYLDKRNSSSQVSSVTLKHETTTKTKRLQQEQMAAKNITYPELLDDGEATHVISSITYGANAFFKFEKKIGKQESKKDVSGQLAVMVKSIPSFSIEGKGEIEITEESKKNFQSIECQFVGDYPANIGTPTDFESAIKTFHNLGKHPDLIKVVPIIVGLTPLHTLDSKALQMVREVSRNTVEQSSKLMAYLDDVQARLNTLKGHKTALYFSSFKQFVETVKAQFAKKSNLIKQTMATILPSIREGGTEETELLKLLADFETSVFSEAYFNSWYAAQLDEAQLMDNFLTKIESKGISVAKTKGCLKQHMNNDGGLIVLSANFVSNQNAELLEDLKENSNDIPADYKYPQNENSWIHDDDFYNKLLKIRRSFVSTSDIGDNKQNFNFVADLRYDQETNSCSLKSYEDGALLDEDLDLKVELGNVRYEEGSLVADFVSGTAPKMEVRYKLMTDSAWTTSDNLPKLGRGVYLAQMRFVLENGLVGDWKHPDPIEFEVKGNFIRQEWSDTTKDENIRLFNDRLEAHCIEGGGIPACVQASFPIPVDKDSYFEIEIINGGEDDTISVGLSVEGYDLKRHVGWNEISLGYHGDDGRLFFSTGTGKVYGPTFTTGDVVGCFMSKLGVVFFTKNGQYLGLVESRQPSRRDVPALFPTVGLKGANVMVKANFGHKSFTFPSIQEDD